MKLLEKYIRQIIESETNATPEKPFGDYLFGDARNKPEKDNFEERVIYAQLKDWIKLNNSEHKSNLLPKIKLLVSLLDSGSYSDVLQPPKGVVYRGTAVRSVDALKNTYGISSYGGSKVSDGKLFLEKSNHIYKSRASEITSWTYDSKTAVDFMLTNSWHNWSNLTYVGILLVAKVPDSGVFVLNYEEVPSLSSEREQEVLSLGDVACDVYLMPVKEAKTYGGLSRANIVADLGDLMHGGL